MAQLASHQKRWALMATLVAGSVIVLMLVVLKTQGRVEDNAGGHVAQKRTGIPRAEANMAANGNQHRPNSNELDSNLERQIAEQWQGIVQGAISRDPSLTGYFLDYQFYLDHSLGVRGVAENSNLQKWIEAEKFTNDNKRSQLEANVVSKSVFRLVQSVKNGEKLQTNVGGIDVGPILRSLLSDASKKELFRLHLQNASWDAPVAPLSKMSIPIDQYIISLSKDSPLITDDASEPMNLPILEEYAEKSAANLVCAILVNLQIEAALSADELSIKGRYETSILRRASHQRTHDK